MSVQDRALKLYPGDSAPLPRLGRVQQRTKAI